MSRLLVFLRHRLDPCLEELTLIIVVNFQFSPSMCDDFPPFTHTVVRRCFVCHTTSCVWLRPNKIVRDVCSRRMVFLATIQSRGVRSSCSKSRQQMALSLVCWDWLSSWWDMGLSSELTLPSGFCKTMNAMLIRATNYCHQHIITVFLYCKFAKYNFFRNHVNKKNYH